MPFNSLLKRKPLLICVLIIVCIIILVVFIKLIGIDYSINYLGEYGSESHFGVYEKYAVSTDSAQCAHIGKKILSVDGTAADAAIAMLLCMGVTLPHSMGLGGGSLILFYNSTTKQTFAIDAREEAPKQSHKDLFLNITGDNDLPLSIGVPGELSGYWELHQRFGRLEWSQLFTGAINLAKNGFYVSKHLDNSLKRNEKYIKMFSPLREIFINKTTNECYREGNRITNEKLAQTLQMLANSSHPLNLFYNGLISQYIIEDIEEFNRQWNLSAVITLDDFRNYETRINLHPVTTMLKRDNLILNSFPLPGSGNVLSLILNVMQKYDDLYPKAGKTLEMSTLFYHRLIETFKYAYSHRTLLEDSPDIHQNFNYDSLAEEIKNSIDDTKTYSLESGKYGHNIKIIEDKGTAHVSVVDREGNAVAVSTTINSYFGSKILSKRTGILLNDEMFDFKLKYEKFNYPSNQTNLIKPGKRPFSSMCPTIITDSSGKVKLAIGAAGGTKITTAVAMVIIRHLFFDEDLKHAIDAPRIHHQLSPDVITYEDKFPQNILEGLSQLGHKPSLQKGRGAVVMAISSNHNKLYANSDYRKGGDVDGL